MSAGEGLVYELLGMDPADYNAAMHAGMRTFGWDGMPCTSEPRWHSHPALGITGHAHSQDHEARRPHVHRPVVAWDFTPVFVRLPADDEPEACGCCAGPGYGEGRHDHTLCEHPCCPLADHEEDET